MSTDQIRILVVADDPLARAGLATILSDDLDNIVVGRISNITDLQDDLTVYQPDLLVWDMGWNPDTNLEQLTNLDDADLPIICLLPDEAAVSAVWQAEVQGLLRRDADAETLATALAAVMQGLTVLDDDLARNLSTAATIEADVPIEALTSRELDVLQLLAEGLANKEIARRLDISTHTVKFHVNAILGKLAAQSRTEAVVRATRMGLIIL